jgi:signal transduction histidine kinase
MNIEVRDDKTLHEVNRFLLFNLFFNLVNNAIKYNKEQGEIAIKAFKEDGRYVIEVSDTGIGIPAEQVPFIFNRFKKFKQSAQQESFGLGLPIVKSIADFHKIGIEVSSELGAGSRFRLIFP